MKIKNTRICSEMILLFICTILLSTNPVFSATLFSDDFESGLAKWSTIGSGVIVSDPLEPNNHALSFTGLKIAGDIFSRQIVNATGSYILSFDYLGTCSGKNCGGFIGYEPGDVWVGGTDPNGYFAPITILPDTGSWERVTIVFSGPTTISLKLEDWSGSGGVPGDVYFDNILLTDGNGPSTSPPAAFNKTSPANGAINQSTSPTLTWEASTGATSYEYCYDTTNDNACSSWMNNGTSTSASLSGLANGTTYYWLVRAVNADGPTYSDNSSTAFWSFTTIVNPPAAFNKTSPANGATNQSTSPTLTWEASTGANSYEYCYDTTNNNACDGSWTSVGSGTSATLSGLSPETTYYWQVRANNISGTTEAGGAGWWSFTTSQPHHLYYLYLPMILR